jgi:uncharacterized repeat protein (TIGR03803 family)
LIPTNGKWTEKVLHSFKRDGQDGIVPYAGLVLDTNGNLYGTTWEGGIYSAGTVFELVPNNGKWTEKVLHSFDNSGGDGAYPHAGLILDTTGRLYGTTQGGGNAGGGTVFELTPNQGEWTEKQLYLFNPFAKDGWAPEAPLIMDRAGNLYGTYSGGTYNWGGVFELILNKGKWTERVLHQFMQNGKDGAYILFGGLVFDATGNLYGMTRSGGSGTGCGSNGCGTVFEVAP